MPKKILVIKNPISGSGKKLKRVEDTIALLKNSIHDVSVYETLAAGDATAYLLKLEDSFDTIVAAGGDGTINEVINGLVDIKNITLAVIPAGTTNVLAKELNLPKGAAALADIIINGKTKPVFLGRLNNKRFLMMVGVGYDAWAVNYADLSIKKRFGKLAYIISMFTQYWNYGRQFYEVEIDGKSMVVGSMIITQGKYYAGSFLLSHQADLSHPTLQVITMSATNRLSFLLSCLALPFGLLEKAPNVKSFSAKEVLVKSVNNIPELDVLQMDGDSAGATPAKLSIEEEAISILVKVE